MSLQERMDLVRQYGLALKAEDLFGRTGDLPKVSDLISPLAKVKYKRPQRPASPEAVDTERVWAEMAALGIIPSRTT